jgi:hypothetical protein
MAARSPQASHLPLAQSRAAAVCPASAAHTRLPNSHGGAALRDRASDRTCPYAACVAPSKIDAGADRTDAAEGSCYRQ